MRPRLMYRSMKCVHTHYRCIRACPSTAIQINNDGDPALNFDRSFCDHCDGMDCVSACYNEALEIAGRYFTVDELMRILHRDQGFWGDQGGVTFTGGDPLLQKEFLLAVLKKCRSDYIHTAVETCAHVNTNTLLEIQEWTDWMIIDIKHMNSAMHWEETGVGNELVLKNIKAMVSVGWDGKLIIRVPIIPGYNDASGNFHAIAELMKELKLTEVNILPFHRLGSSKYEQIGLEYKFAHLESPSRETMLTVKQIFEAAGLQCYVDFESPY